MTSGVPFDRAALERTYVRLERPVYNVVYRLTWSAEDAHDIVQEAFVRLWTMRERVRPETVDPLVYRIALNLARNRRRWARLRSFFGLDERHADQRPGADERLLGEERALEIRAAVDRLPEGERAVILLTHFSELSYREVAGILDIPEGTVGSRRNSALRALRDALGRTTTTEVIGG